MKKVLFVATVVKTHIMEFHIPYLKLLKDLGWDTAVAAKNDYDNPDECKIPYCDRYYDIDFERNPFTIKNIKALQQLKRIIDKEHYDVIHCHTPVGSVLARLAARQAQQKGTKVFYTAHGFHFFSGAPISSWILFYPIEWWLSHYTDVLFTINTEDYHRAIQHFHAKQVVKLPGIGIDTKLYNLPDSFKRVIRKKLQLDDCDFVVLSVGELTSRKNHITVIKAIEKCNNKHIKYLIAGQGEKKVELLEYIEQHKLDNVILLGYRHDIPELCKAADVFLFPSRREGLGLAAIEAMASGLPVISSNVNGINDYMEDGVTGYMCPPLDIDMFADRILQLYDNRQECIKIGKNNIEAAKKYDISKPLRITKEIYETI